MDFYELNLMAEATNRYSVEVNYRTTVDEVRQGFAKMLLGFVSAALKERGYHVKRVLDETPFRIIVSSRNWTDGEWVLIVSYHPKMDCMILSRGFYNKDRDTVTVQSNEKCAGHSAAEVFRTVYNRMNKIKDEPPHHDGDLKPVKGQSGPIKGVTRPTQSANIAPQIMPNSADKIGM